MIKVTILGCASAKPTVSSHPSAQVVNVNEQYYLVDAGEGTQQQMFRMGINPLKLRGVFISHLHGDHIFGLFPLLSTMGLCGRQTALKVYAPRPFGEILEYHLRYFDTQLPYQVEWVEVDTTKHQCIFENRTLEVWSVPLRWVILPTKKFALVLSRIILPKSSGYSEHISRVNFASHFDKRAPHLRQANCGPAFSFGTKYPLRYALAGCMTKNTQNSPWLKKSEGLPIGKPSLFLIMTSAY